MSWDQKLMTMRFYIGTLVVLLFSLCPASSIAKLPAEILSLLDNELTPMGAIRSGSDDSLIPQWTGAVLGLPDGLEWDGPGTPYPDPWPGESPLFVIDNNNKEAHLKRLSPGLIAMLNTYPETFHIPVYAGHREFRHYENYYSKVRYNAENAELTPDNEGISGFIGGPAFPVPRTGAEVVWLTRTTEGYETLEGDMHDYFVFANGDKSYRRTELWQQTPYGRNDTVISVDNEYPKRGEFAGYIMTVTKLPARDKGTITSVMEPFDYTRNDRETWRYLPGSRRVRRAPTVGFDTPDGPGGLKTIDELRGFNGSLERFDWHLIGRKEIFVPYHSYRFDSPNIDYNDLLTRYHANPDHMRYELKRVWVAEAKLKEGQRHIYGMRRIYVDEDSGLTLIAENYDGRGELWKVVLFNSLYDFHSQQYIRRAQMYHDLRSGAYSAERLVNDGKTFLYDISPPRPPAYFSPSNVRKLGKR